MIFKTIISKQVFSEQNYHIFALYGELVNINNQYIYLFILLTLNIKWW